MGKESLRNFSENRKWYGGTKLIYKSPKRPSEHLYKVSCQSAQPFGRDVSTDGQTDRNYAHRYSIDYFPNFHHLSSSTYQHSIRIITGSTYAFRLYLHESHFFHWCYPPRLLNFLNFNIPYFNTLPFSLLFSFSFFLLFSFFFSFGLFFLPSFYSPFSSMPEYKSFLIYLHHHLKKYLAMLPFRCFQPSINLSLLIFKTNTCLCSHVSFLSRCLPHHLIPKSFCLHFHPTFYSASAILPILHSTSYHLIPAALQNIHPRPPSPSRLFHIFLLTIHWHSTLHFILHDFLARTKQHKLYCPIPHRYTNLSHPSSIHSPSFSLPAFYYFNPPTHPFFLSLSSPFHLHLISPSSSLQSIVTISLDLPLSEAERFLLSKDLHVIPITPSSNELYASRHVTCTIPQHSTSI